MAEFQYGPVDLYLVGFGGDRPDPGTIEAIRDLIDAGDIRLLDLVIVSSHENGTYTLREITEVSDEFGLGFVELEATGLVGDDDVEEFAAQVPPGTSAALLAIELVWARKLAERFHTSGGVVLTAERIPATVVNAALAEASDDED